MKKQYNTDWLKQFKEFYNEKFKKNLREEFFKRYHGEGEFPKRIADPVLCDDIVEFIINNK